LEIYLNREKGTVFKDPGGKVNVCLVYPNTYHVGMSNLGYQGMYRILNERDDTVCERSFMPDNEDLKEYNRTGSELFTLESKRPLNRFDIVGFSVSFENDYLSIPHILRLARISEYHSLRGENGPVILLGGVCATINPEPIADFFDLIFIGEADTAVHDLIETYKISDNRRSFLGLISEVEGFYVPGFYRISYFDDGRIKERGKKDGKRENIKKRTKGNLDGDLRPAIITPDTEFSSMYLLEAMRGCTWNCRFCVAGHIYNPPRHKSLEVLKKEIDLVNEKAERVGMIGPSLTDYAHVEEALKINGSEFSITSLRATPKAQDIVLLMKDKRSVSIAPEAGTERMRRVINKKVTEADIMETSELILKGGIQTLRLYFMVGLPFETEEDIEGIIDLTKKIRSLSSRGSLVLSLSTFVPKPFTPFQWHPMALEKVIKARSRKIKSGLNMKGVRVFHDVLKYAHMQGVFSRGDRRMAQAIDRIKEPGRWMHSMTGMGLKPDFYLLRERTRAEILPWDFIDAGIPKEHLWQEYEEARELADSE
jgi:radical SAM superfamily enzyme YgiQ (UPF0313 family)